MTELDRLAKRLTELPRQRNASHGSNKDIPRLLWSDGVTNLTDLSARYRVGIMFTIVVVSLQFEGFQFFTDVFKDVKVVKNMIECFQMILCYWMWLKKKKYWKRDDKDSPLKAHEAIRKMRS